MTKILQLIFKKIFQIIFITIYGKITYNINDKKDAEKILIKEAKDSFFLDEKYYTYEIRNGRIYTDYVENVAIIQGKYLFKRTSFQQINGRLSNPKLNSVLIKGTPRIKKKFKGTILNLVQGASSVNYFHWLFDMLPKIFICSKNYNIKKIDYFYLSEPQKFQKDLLKFFKIKENKIINSKLYRHIQADNIITCDHPWYSKGYFYEEFDNCPKWIVTWLRNNFIKNRKKFYASKKIFIDRADSKNNHVNEKIIITEVLDRPGDISLKFKLKNLLKIFHKKVFFFKTINEPLMTFYPTVNNKDLDIWYFLSPKIIINFLSILGFEKYKINYHKQICKGKYINMFTIVADRTLPINKCFY